MEKCNRDNRVEGGGRQVRGTGQLIRACVFSLPACCQSEGKVILRTRVMDERIVSLPRRRMVLSSSEGRSGI